MIEIKFEAATGADLRKEMLDLLGLSSGEIVHKHIIEGHGLELEGNVSANEEITSEVTKAEETPKPEKTTRTRRSKAEIEAEAALAANTGSEEPPASTENAETTPAVEEPGETAVTAEDLTKKCVELGRNGKRDAVLAVFESQFGGATISKKDGKPQLTAEQYPAVMEALNALA